MIYWLLVISAVLVIVDEMGEASDRRKRDR
jgi:hypothetical protein